MTGLLLGCVADDFTGGTDLANNLVRAGMRVVQTIGVPDRTVETPVDAIVVALKSRTIRSQDAVARSLAAMRWLRAQGARQIYFKYCSTFDSTAEGNIGPVTEALMDAMKDLPGADFTIATPAFPDNARTIFKGHLFVGDVLLNESGMQNHPLTPMRDANLVRVLQPQCRRRVGLVDYRVVARGAEAIRTRIGELRGQGISIAIVDALSNEDLVQLGLAAKDMPLVTAGSGLAIGLPANFGIAPSENATKLPKAAGARAVVSGSCSVATNRQVRRFIEGGGPALAVDPLKAGSGADVVPEILRWAAPRIGAQPLLIYSTAEPKAVAAVQERLGAGEAGALIERTLAAVARGLVGLGVRQLIIAGGETSGACIQALDVTQLAIGPQIDPGVPWCAATVAGSPMHLALKSGNFGANDFFTRAFSHG
jgi:3-dehydrotetronate 4-kinase